MATIAIGARTRTYSVAWSDQRIGWTARQHTQVQIIDGYSDLGSVPKIIAIAHLEGVDAAQYVIVLDLTLVGDTAQEF